MYTPYYQLWPYWLYNIFPHYLINSTIFEKNLSNMKWVFWLSIQLLSERFLITRRVARDVIENVHCSSCKVSIILVQISWNLNFLDRFFKILNQISWKSVQWELNFSMWTDGETDKTKQIVTFLILPICLIKLLKNKKELVPTAKKTYCVSIIISSHLMIFRKLMAMKPENKIKTI